MRKSYEIIVFAVLPPFEGDGYVSYGTSLRSVESYENDETALRMNDQFIKVGLGVVVRPQQGDGDRSFHEYRSFDGKPFERIDFTA